MAVGSGRHVNLSDGFPRVGIVGGGQLGKMLAVSAKKMGLYVTVLDPTPDCPASGVSDEQIVADFKDEDAIRLLGEKSDHVTFEIELANASVLKELNTNGCHVNPSPETLHIIQSKFRQKNFLQNHGLPVPAFREVKFKEDIQRILREFNGHAMLKMSQDSYDGRGNVELNEKTNVEEVFSRIQGRECFVEEWVPFQKELSVMVARNDKGEMAVYPVAENIHTESILDTSIVPARIQKDLAFEAQRVAMKTIQRLEGSGVFGIELFLTNENRILINEIAPRVHNSGHYTLEACKTSQFNQHIRAILNWPLGSTEQIYPAVMVNILGKSQGPFFMNGLSRILQIDGTYLHLYGKKESKPKRKMGHVTTHQRTILENPEKYVGIAPQKTEKIVNHWRKELERI